MRYEFGTPGCKESIHDQYRHLHADAWMCKVSLQLIVDEMGWEIPDWNDIKKFPYPKNLLMSNLSDRKAESCA